MGSAIGSTAGMLDEETTGQAMEFLLRFASLVPEVLCHQ